MRVLAIDTCGPVIGVALLVDAHVAVRTDRVTRGAETRLMPWALELAAEAGVALSDLDGVAAAVGPGAFTGLRVGLAAAAGVALAAGVPIWPGSSLVSRAVGTSAEQPVLTMLDARKGRVYAALVGPDGTVLAGPGDLEPAAALALVDGPFVATGEGALAYREQVEAAGGTIVAQAADPCVDALARLGARGLRAGQGVAAEAVEPVYLRAPDAKPPKDLGGIRPR